MKLIDTNIIIRFLVGDNLVMFEKTKLIFKDIEDRKISVEILESVLSECVYVLSGVYEIEKKEICTKLIQILNLDSIKSQYKIEMINSLKFYSENNLDFVDCLLICIGENNSKKIITFDKKILSYSIK